jgi:hypothetical protein
MANSAEVLPATISITPLPGCPLATTTSWVMFSNVAGNSRDQAERVPERTEACRERASKIGVLVLSSAAWAMPSVAVGGVPPWLPH